MGLRQLIFGEMIKRGETLRDHAGVGKSGRYEKSNECNGLSARTDFF